MIIAFKAATELGNHFPFNDKIINKNGESIVVYNVNFKNCDAYWKLEKLKEHVQQLCQNLKKTKTMLYSYILRKLGMKLIT